MTIRRKTFLIVAGILILLGASTMFLAGALIMRHARSDETEQALLQGRRALNALASKIEDLDRTTRDWAFWDDTCEFVENLNDDYLRSNLVDETFRQSAFNLIVIADAEGKLLFGRFLGPEQDLTRDIPDTILIHLRPDSPLFTHADVDSSHSGVLVTDETPLLISSRPILTSNQEGPLRGTFIIGRLFDQAAVKKLGSTTLLSLRLHPLLQAPLQSPMLDCLLASGEETPVVVCRPDTQTITACALVRDVFGNPSFILEEQSPRTFIAAATRELRLFFILTIIICGAAIAVILILLNQLVLGRTARLHEFANTFHTTGDLSARVRIGGNDELTELANAFNRMLAVLEIDISRRREAEATLKEQQAFLRSVIDAHPGYVWVKDRDSRFVLVNEGLARFCRTTADKMIGKLDSDFNTNKEEVARFHREDGEVFQSGLPMFVREERITNLDGSLAWISTFKVPLLNERGECHRLLAISIDITDRKRAEEALRQSEERYRGIYETAPVAVVIWDRDCRITDWNPHAAKIFGWSQHEVRGNNFFEFLVPEEDRRSVHEVVHSLLNGTLPSHNTNRNCTKSGGTIICEWNNAILRDSQGRVTGAISLGVDVTERKRAEEERRELENMMQQTQKLESLGVLAGGIAHDFNNLLMAILGNADLALAELPAESPVRNTIEDIVLGSRRAAELCRQMLAYSGKGRFLIEPLDLSRVVREMAHMLEVAVSKKAVLRYNFAENLPALEADATQIRQVVMNLIINASEAIGDRSGVIAVSTGAMECEAPFLRQTLFGESLAPGLYVYVEVADTGVGMDEATLARIFDPFFTTKFAGRGLGLAAVIGIVRSHHGTIRVQSAPDEGTTFRILFPASEKTAGDTAPQPEAQEWRANGTILVVDDEETIRTLAKRMIQRCGLRVLSAADGREAVNVFRQAAGRIDCVLLDLTMPHMDGHEAFREMRAIRPEVPVILSSGYSEHDVTRRFAGVERIAFIEKPYTRGTLIAALRKLMEAKPA